MRKDCLIVVLSLLCQLAIVAAKSGEDHWVWRTYSRRERGFRDKDIDRNAAINNSYDNKQRREPTTRRPLPGEPENDEIEDYVDADPPVTNSPNVSTRQFNPYLNLNAFPGQPTTGGQFGGQGGFVGNNPGVLVGPGGPPGIIGGHPYPYPNVYQPSGIGGFGGGQNGLGLGLGGYPVGGIYGGTGLGGSAYPGLGGSFGGFTSAQPGAGLSQGQFPAAGNQYPFGPYQGAGSSFNNNQFAAPGGQYPGGQYSGGQYSGGQYSGGQYPGGQYPGAQYTGGQYPGGHYPNGQYPSNQYGGAQFPNGYGLLGAGLGHPGLPPTGFGGNFGAGGFGYDEKSPEGKSAKSVTITPTSVNDKLSKKA
ncbi:hypothetical protein ACLKA7_016435 [Drosophila subpalustris]